MVSRQTKTLLALCLGTVLLVNPAFALPGEPTRTYTYDAVPATDAAVEHTRSYEANVLRCRGVSRACLLERRVAAGSVRLPTEHANASDVSDYAFVRLDDGFYRPVTRVENGSYVLTHEAVAERAVLDALAFHDEDGLPDVARRAVTRGPVTVAVSLGDDAPIETPLLVEAGGRYRVVRVTAIELDRPVTNAAWVSALRLGGVAVGAALVLYGYNLLEE